MLRLCIFAFVAIWQVKAAAIEVSLSELQQYQDEVRYAPKLLDYEVASAEQVEKLEQIHLVPYMLITADWLSRLAAMDNISVQQREWVEKQTRNPLTLSAPLAEHPEKTVKIVDIRALSKRTQALWSMREKADAVHFAWQNHQLNWRDLTDSTSRRALLHWINSLETADAGSVAGHFEAFGLEHFAQDTQVIGALALASDSIFLFDVLWQQPADEHVYRVLQMLGEHQRENNASHIAKATRNEKLVSQGYLLLASRYADQKIAQKTLLEGMASRANEWHAAAAMQSVTDPMAKAVLLEALSSEQNVAQKSEQASARSWAIRALSEEGGQ